MRPDDDDWYEYADAAGDPISAAMFVLALLALIGAIAVTVL